MNFDYLNDTFFHWQLNLLRREAATQELLESTAKVLKQRLAEEIKILEKTEGIKKQHAQMIARVLRREEHRLEQIAKELSEAQDERRIEYLEVEMRAIEVRIYEALRLLHFEVTSPTTRPATASPRPVTTARPNHSYNAEPSLRPSTGSHTTRGAPV